MSGSHTRWARNEANAEDPERIAIREALAFGKAVYDRRVALGLSIAELAHRTAMTADEIECIEEGGTEPTVAAAPAGGRPRRRRPPHPRPRPRLRRLRNPRRLTAVPSSPVRPQARPPGAG